MIEVVTLIIVLVGYVIVLSLHYGLRAGDIKQRHAQEKAKMVWERVFSDKEERTPGIWPFTEGKKKKYKEWNKE